MTENKKQNAEKNIQKEIVKNPKEAKGIEQETEKIVKEVKQENKESTEKIKQAETPKKIEVKKIEKPKKNEAKIGVTSAPISTRHSVALCKFVKRKNIDEAIKELEEVVAKKRALPMKGEFAHRKGKGIMSGKYPQISTKYFIKILKSLQSNANANDIKNPIILEAIANLAPRPLGRFGRYTRKRTHITIIAKNMEKKNKEIHQSLVKPGENK